MDWKKTFSRGQWIIHSIFLVVMIIGIGCTIFSLKLNHQQTNEEDRILKINSLLSFLKTDNSFEKIGKYLTWAESDKAHDKMRDFSQKIAETEELVEIKSSKDLSQSVRNFNKFISNGSINSNPNDALKVLKQKISNLADIAKSQGYKNVGIIADRMLGRIANLNPKNVGNSIQVGYLKSDLERVDQLVSSSTLEDVKKAALKTRFESMNNELGLLVSLNGQSRDLKSHVTKASLALSEWLIDVELKARDLKGMRLQKQNQLVIFLAVLIGFIAISWMGLAYLFRWQKIKMGEQIESEVKNVIEKGIIGDQRFMVDHYSDFTRNDIIRLLDDLKIKLNLGSMLHDGLPFAGCMIDNSFKLTWFNQLFLEQLYLSEEEVRSDAFNWDYVRDYLNLDEDPIYQALVNKIAGIYPVKVKQDELTHAQPYEMYVTPISVNREDRVMVFFYPLISVREAITEQVNLTQQSIKQFISLWNDEKLNQDEIRILEKNFKSNDLSDLYKNLVDIFERLNSEKLEYIRAIRLLESENADYSRKIDHVVHIEENKKDIIRQEFRLTQDLRETFIDSINKTESLFQINKSIMQQNDDLRGDAFKLQTLSHDFLKKNRETLEILTQLEGVKVDYKKLKFELLEVKAKLISINNSFLGQLPPLDESQQKFATRYKDELARLDFNVCTLDKKLSQLDVLLAKLHMMHEKSSVQQINFNFQTSQKDHELREALLDLQKKISTDEEKIIDNLQNLHLLMKKDLTAVNETFELAQKESGPLYS